MFYTLLFFYNLNLTHILNLHTQLLHVNFARVSEGNIREDVVVKITKNRFERSELGFSSFEFRKFI